MRWYTLIVLAFMALSTAGCDFEVGEDGAEMSFSESEQADLYSIVSRDDKVKMGLTEDVIYFGLSDELRQEVKEEMAEEMEGAEGRLERSLISIVSRGVSKALNASVSYELKDVRELRWEDGRIVIELEDGPADLDDFDVDGDDISRVFREGDVRRFAEEVERVKSGG